MDQYSNHIISGDTQQTSVVLNQLSEDNVMDVPFRFIPCMAAGLAYYVAGKFPQGGERLMMLKQQYDEAWELAAYEDHEKAALRLVPRQTYIGR